ncbi:MAG: hypothetical protein V7K27_23255 [Nostoc sp.]|uniref:hypothetical protein n=1 Tax=Nostoc sp. TaxID=1180 RepID=UPI002FFD2226
MLKASAVSSITEERQRAGGRRQKEENTIFALCQKGLKPLNLFMKKNKNIFSETRSAKKNTSLLNPLNLFMGIPSASCLLPSAFLIYS